MENRRHERRIGIAVWIIAIVIGAGFGLAVALLENTALGVFIGLIVATAIVAINSRA